jgi:NADH:ubiquinone oxidoreductase subunit F (NADH-binding)
MTITPPIPLRSTGVRRLSSLLDAPGGWTTLAEHRRRFEAPPAAHRAPDENLIDTVERAGLHGRGGAGFPTAVKLRAVAGGRRRPVVLVNGSEGEPTSTKDAVLMSRAPHVVLDGALLAASAVGADEVIVGVKIGAGNARASIARALGERYVTESWTPRVRIIDVPPRYLAGEERALVNLIERGRAIPPPGPWRPFERGVSGRPTLVQNVETLSHLAMIREMGADWFRSVGHAQAPGTMLVTLSGAVATPGVLEVATGYPVAGCLGAGGQATEEAGAVLVGGYSGAWLTNAECARATLDRSGMAAVDGVIGCAAIVVLPASACGIQETARVMRWLADQTAGQCGPCVHGLAAIAEGTEQLARGAASANVLKRLHRWAGDVEGRGACRYPDGAVRLLRSALRTFEADAARHASGRPCVGAARSTFLPLPDVGRVT